MGDLRWHNDRLFYNCILIKPAAIVLILAERFVFPNNGINIIRRNVSPWITFYLFLSTFIPPSFTSFFPFLSLSIVIYLKSCITLDHPLFGDKYHLLLPPITIFLKRCIHLVIIDDLSSSLFWDTYHLLRPPCTRNHPLFRCIAPVERLISRLGRFFPYFPATIPLTSLSSWRCLSLSATVDHHAPLSLGDVYHYHQLCPPITLYTEASITVYYLPCNHLHHSLFMYHSITFITFYFLISLYFGDKTNHIYLFSPCLLLLRFLVFLRAFLSMQHNVYTFNGK